VQDSIGVSYTRHSRHVRCRAPRRVRVKASWTFSLLHLPQNGIPEEWLANVVFVIYQSSTASAVQIAGLVMRFIERVVNVAKKVNEVGRWLAWKRKRWKLAVTNNKVKIFAFGLAFGVSHVVMTTSLQGTCHHGPDDQIVLFG